MATDNFNGWEQDTLFLAVTNSTRDAIIMMDEQGNVSFWNPAAENILGYHSDEIVGKNLHSLLAPSRYLRQHQDAFSIFRKTGCGNAIDNTLELEAVHKHGHEISVELSLSIIQVRKRVYALGIIRDVTERKKAEEELKKSEERFRALHNASFGGIAIHDKGVILDCNQGLAEMTGYSLEELIGMDGLLLIAEKCRDSVMARIRKGYEKPYESVAVRKDGSEFPIRLQAKNIPVKDKTVRVTEFRDITEQMRMREEQEDLQKQLLQVQKVESIGRLAGGIAHDLNNLLSPILGYSELLLDNLDFSERYRKQISVIFDAASRSRDLVRQLLAFSRKQTLDVRPTNLNNIVENLKKLLRRIIPEDIALEVDLCTEPCVAMADINQIEQIIVNLSVNAAHAMPGGGTLRIMTFIEDETGDSGRTELGRSPGKYAVLSVRDTGTGISEDIQHQIFEPFFSTKGELGVGLGLATVYGIVKQHNGDIEVHSQPGKGACFTIYLPFSDREYAGDEKLGERREKVLLAGSETILIVEDDEHVRQLATTILSMHGYHVLTAGDGEDAVEMFNHFDGTIDMLLTDVILPGMNGKALSEKLTRRVPGLKTIYMSGYPANVINSMALQKEGGAFIQKPFTRSALLEKIKDVLTNR